MTDGAISYTESKETLSKDIINNFFAHYSYVMSILFQLILQPYLPSWVSEF